MSSYTTWKSKPSRRLSPFLVPFTLPELSQAKLQLEFSNYQLVAHFELHIVNQCTVLILISFLISLAQCQAKAT